MSNSYKSEFTDNVKHLISNISRSPDLSITICDAIVSEYIRDNSLPNKTDEANLIHGECLSDSQIQI